MSTNFCSFPSARCALAFAVLAALSASASAQNSPVNALHFEGRSSDWFDANNWREGRVPGANDDVVLDRGDIVVIDPERGASPVEIRDLIVGDGAELTTLPGTIMGKQPQSQLLCSGAFPQRCALTFIDQIFWLW